MGGGRGAYLAAAGTVGIALTCCLTLALPAAGAAPTTRFVSKHYHYSIALPGDSGKWKASYAFISWSFEDVSPNTPQSDTFTDLRNQRLFIIAARRPPKGSTLTKWTAFSVAHLPSVCSSKHSESGTTLDGAPARALSWSCSDGYFAYGVTALHRGRGYFMIVATPENVSHASDHKAFEAARRSFRFSKR